MRRPRVVLLVTAALCLTLTGCGGGDGDGDADAVKQARKGVPVPSPSGSYEIPKPAGKPPGDAARPDEQILYDLQERVVAAAGVPAKTKAECEGGVITGTVDQTVTCGITYEGLVVRYEVDIEGGTPTFNWTAVAESSVLTAEGVGLAYWAKRGDDAAELRCDRMPEKKLVKLGRDTGYRCYRKSKDTWVSDAVVLADGKITFRSAEAE
ncbi:MAG: hypothetical protein GEU94_09650 [Micromonosporaceae bacterium]|nr:hypothetical protein [Micromonosporaceae bacterium]